MCNNKLVVIVYAWKYYVALVRSIIINIIIDLLACVFNDIDVKFIVL